MTTTIDVEDENDTLNLYLLMAPNPNIDTVTDTMDADTKII